MELTGTGDNVPYDNVYVSPYNGKILLNGQIAWSGLVICDDFETESSLNQLWNVTATKADDLNGTEKFAGTTYDGYDTQDEYNAVAWLANLLLLGTDQSKQPNVSTATDQIYISFAIWDIFDHAAPDPGSQTDALITRAFAAVRNGPVYTNVDVFTPNPKTASQEFLVVNGPPIPTPEPSEAGLLGVDLLCAVGVIFLVRRRQARSSEQ